MGSLINSVLFFVFIVGSGVAQAEVTYTPQTVINGVFAQVRAPIPLFAEDSTFRFELVSDFSQILKLKEKDTTTKLPAKIIYLQDGVTQEINVKLGTRGVSKQGFCKNFRPLRIYFDTAQTDLSQTMFKGISDDLKIATHCDGLGVIQDSARHVQQIIREQTAYKMLEALGFMSLKTRSAHITYKNMDGSVVADAQAFLLEPKSNMAKRYGLKHIKKFKADIIFAPEPENRISFQFSTRFLMHTDVDFGGEHNTILITSEGAEKALAMIPYDFDLTGMVIDSHYQGTAHAYKQWTLQGWGDDGEWFKDKMVGGKYTSDEFKNQAYTTAAHVLNHKDDVQKVIDESPAIDKSIMQERINAFFSGIERAVSEK